MVVIQKALCVGVCCPSPPLIMLITQTCWTVFHSGNSLLLFFTCSPPTFSLHPTDTPVSLFLSSICLPPPPYPSFLPPCPLHSSPGAVGGRKREGEREDRPALLKTLFTPGTKQHVISALGETLTRARKEGNEGGRTETGGQEVKQN